MAAGRRRNRCPADDGGVYMLEVRSTARKPARQSRPHRQRGRAALWRAYCAAQAYHGSPVSPTTLHAAARMYASSPAYVAAMMTVIATEDEDLVDQVFCG